MEPRAINNASESFELRPASIVTRPLRLGYIVNRSVEFELIKQIFQYNCSIWGGKFNLFVPTDGKVIREDWWQMLYQHDPDYLIYVGDVDTNLQELVYRRLQPFWHYLWTDNWIKGFMEDRNSIGAVPVRILLAQYQDVYGRLTSERSRCAYPECSKSRFATFLELAYGNYPPEANFHDAFMQVLGGAEIRCSSQTLGEYLSEVDTLNDRHTPIEFTKRHLQVSYEVFGNSPNLIISNGEPDDLFLFHAVRMSAWPLGQPPLIVRLDEVEDDHNLAELSEWMGRHRHGNQLHIASASLNLDVLRNVRERFREFLPGWQINLRCGNFGVWAPRVYHQERQRLITHAGQEVSFELPETTLDGFLSKAMRWVTEIRQTGLKAYRNGLAPSMFSTLNYALSAVPDDTWFRVLQGGGIRIARGELALRVGTTNHVAQFTLPTEQQLVTKALEDTGFKVTYDEKGRYFQGMIGLAGGELRDVAFLREKTVRDLICKMNSGQSCTWNWFAGQAKLGKDAQRHTDLQALVYQLAEKQILIRGMRLQCPACKLTMSYALNTLTERIVCQGCRTPFQMALDHESFGYQANQLFVRGIEQGALTTLLTALLLFNSTEIGMHWKAGCILESVEHNGIAELDLVAMCDGRLVVAECKDNIQGDFERTPERILEQLRRVILAADKVKADLFVLSTLSEQVPQPVLDVLAQMSDSTSPLNVQVVTRADLERGWITTSNADNSERPSLITELVKGLPGWSEVCVEYDPDVKSGFVALG